MILISLPILLRSGCMSGTGGDVEAGTTGKRPRALDREDADLIAFPIDSLRLRRPDSDFFLLKVFASPLGAETMGWVWARGSATGLFGGTFTGFTGTAADCKAEAVRGTVSKVKWRESRGCVRVVFASTLDVREVEVSGPGFARSTCELPACSSSSGLVFGLVKLGVLAEDIRAERKFNCASSGIVLGVALAVPLVFVYPNSSDDDCGDVWELVESEPTKSGTRLMRESRLAERGGGVRRGGA